MANGNGRPPTFSLRTFLTVASVVFAAGVAFSSINVNGKSIEKLTQVDNKVKEEVTENKERLIRVEMRQEVMAEDVAEIKEMGAMILRKVS